MYPSWLKDFNDSTANENGEDPEEKAETCIHTGHVMLPNFIIEPLESIDRLYRDRHLMADLIAVCKNRKKWLKFRPVSWICACPMNDPFDIPMLHHIK